MHNIFVLLFSIFIFFILFLFLEKIFKKQKEGLDSQKSAPGELVTSSNFVNYQSNLIDTKFLEKKLETVTNLKDNLADFNKKQQNQTIHKNLM